MFGLFLEAHSSVKKGGEKKKKGKLHYRMSWLEEDSNTRAEVKGGHNVTRWDTVNGQMQVNSCHALTPVSN